MFIENYFNENGLWDLARLKAHCAEHKVRVITTSTERCASSIVMLHYEEEAHFEQAWTPFNVTCRGLIVDLATREVLAYPFDKFFNLGERPETEYDKLLQLGNFDVSEKLDGSMITLFYDRASRKVLATTKGSFDSEHGAFATPLVPPAFQNEDLLREYTLIFELIDSRFRIVVDYKKRGYTEGLYLIGVRHRPSNRLLSFAEVRQFASMYGVKTFKTYPVDSLSKLLHITQSLPVFEEGFVLRFKNDLMVKVKGPAYLQAHKFISNMSPKSILESLQDGTSDELERIAPEEYREEVQQYIEKFTTVKQQIEQDVSLYFTKAPKDTRKDFALWVQQNVPSDLKGFMFMLFDNKPLDRKKIYALVGERQGVSGESKI